MPSMATQMETQEEGIWSAILNNVAATKITPTKNILVLGDPDSGKTTLVARLRNLAAEDNEGDKVPIGQLATLSKQSDTSLQENSADQKGHNNELALSYAFTDVRDEENEDPVARLGIYQLGASDPAYHALLRFPLNSATLPDSLVLITLDWSKPWNFVKTLERWLKVLEEALYRVENEGVAGNGGWSKGKSIVDDIREKLLRYHQEYSEPAGPNLSTNEDRNFSTHTSASTRSVLLPLAEEVLTKNLGMPVAIVCSKSDTLHASDQDLKEEQIDFIQQTLRTICLKYGAALFYTTTRRPETFQRLREYVLHRLFAPESQTQSSEQGTAAEPSAVTTKANNKIDAKRVAFQFPYRGQIVEKDAVMVPAGWDSKAKILLLRDGFDLQPGIDGGQVLLNVYNEVIKNPQQNDDPLRKTATVKAEDEQSFLEKHMEALHRMDPLHRHSVNAGSLGKDIRDSTLVSGSGGAGNTNVLPPSEAQEEIMAKIARINKGTKLSTGVSTNATSNSAPSPSPITGAPSSQNEVLASFFQSLLNKKSTTSPLSSGTNSPRIGSQLPSATSSAAGSLTNLAGGSTNSDVISSTSPESRRRVVAAELSRMKAAAGQQGK